MLSLQYEKDLTHTAVGNNFSIREGSVHGQRDGFAYDAVGGDARERDFYDFQQLHQ